ncbi:hypothetical protein GGI12_003487 [Dipsacomyces acuminosporus]|nr:hypothetical protein GGI12_003487 [Dipsacomyces acuminosporus]
MTCKCLRQEHVARCYEKCGDDDYYKRMMKGEKGLQQIFCSQKKPGEPEEMPILDSSSKAMLKDEKKPSSDEKKKDEEKKGEKKDEKKDKKQEQEQKPQVRDEIGNQRQQLDGLSGSNSNKGLNDFGGKMANAGSIGSSSGQIRGDKGDKGGDGANDGRLLKTMDTDAAVPRAATTGAIALLAAALSLSISLI